VTTSAFRYHDEIPPRVTSPLYRQLIREWVQLNSLTSSTAAMRRWGRLEPSLAGHRRPADLVDAIDAAPRHREDEMLLALIRLAQTGHQLAGRVVLQAMMPKLGKITIRTNGSSPSADNAWSEDRRHIAVAEFWDVLVSYPTGRRTTKIAANLALDTLHRLTAGTRCAQPDLPIDPSEFALTHTSSESPSTYELDEATTAGELTTDADLIQVITWGVTHQVITQDQGQLLAVVYLPTQAGSGSDAAAHQLGISPAAVRQRCSRARRQLITAVQDELAATTDTALTARTA
jgi:DNA-directed RNA polymerase specialized sigma24 family protein